MKTYCNDCKWSRIVWSYGTQIINSKTSETVTNHMECTVYNKDVNPYDSCPIGEKTVMGFGSTG